MFGLNWLLHAKIWQEGHASDWISGWIGAGGAILGSLVTVAWTEYFNARTRKRERREKNAVGSFAAYQKLNQIYSSASQISRHLKNSFQLGINQGIPFKCLATVPIMRLSTQVNFTVDELWTLTRVGGEALLNQVNSLDQAYNALIEIMDRYDKDRALLLEKMTPTEMNGEMGSGAFTKEEFLKIQPGLVQLDSLLTQTFPISTKLVSDTFDALRMLVHAKAKPLGKKFAITLPDLDGVEITINAKDAPRKPRWYTFATIRTWLKKSP
jgi:hypothetical protein